MLWEELKNNECKKEYYKELMKFLDKEYSKADEGGLAVYPPRKDIFKALDLCSLKKVRVVILGQDPYHGKNQATGLAFGVNPGISCPPSLRNIVLEAGGGKFSKDSTLMSWANQGVLLLNTVLTVKQGKPQSHRGKGWETFTDEVIKCVNEHCDGVCFLLWGRDAESKEKLITNKTHIILKSTHPSPLSSNRSAKGLTSFIGNEHFTIVNRHIKGKRIVWVS